MSDNGRNKPAPSGVWKIGSNAYKISSFFWAKLRVVVKSLNSWGKLPGLECSFTIDSEGPQFPSLQTAVITVSSWEERNSGCWVVKEDLREPPKQSLSRPCHNGIWWSSHTKDWPKGCPWQPLRPVPFVTSDLPSGWVHSLDVSQVWKRLKSENFPWGHKPHGPYHEGSLSLGPWLVPSWPRWVWYLRKLSESWSLPVTRSDPALRSQPLGLMNSHRYPSTGFTGMQPGASHRSPRLEEPWLWFNVLSWNSSQFWNKDPTYSFSLSPANDVARAKNSFAAITKRFRNPVT